MASFLRRVASNPETKTVLLASAIYGTIDLLFTGVSFFASPPAARIGTFRQVDTIPGHLALLALAGLALGVISMAAAWRPGVPLVLLFPILVVLTDLDHLPSMLGFSQAIRPAHSFVFVAVTMAVAATVIRRSDIEAVILSAFLAHLSVDTGVFPAFSPFSFQYYQLAPYSLAFIVAAAVLAFCAGILRRRGTLRETK